MSDRIIVALGAGLLLLVLIASATIGTGPTVYAGGGAVLAACVIILHLLRKPGT